jgi:hypothetical protein
MERSMPKRLFRITLAVFLLSIVVSLAPTYAQTPTPPSPRDALIAEIKAYAERHVENNSDMQTQLVVDLYRNNTEGLTPQEIARIYEEEYTRQKEANKPGPLGFLRPSVGWIVAFILLVLLVLRNALEKWLSSLVSSVSEYIYNKLAGKPFFQRTALRHYRAALIGKYEKLHIPFRPNRPLDMGDVYVPLKVTGTADTAQIEAYRAVDDYRKLMIKGAPGSGKSMLLKHIALSYAKGRLDELTDQPVPVLLELHRLNDPKTTIEAESVAELARNDFPHAQRFVSCALEQGTLMLLLDGLDEVNSNERKRVVQHIKDTLNQHKKCRAIITCRTAVYRGDFDEAVNQTLEIVEFNDQQIRHFLASWEKDMKQRGKSIDQLMQTLRDRPHIMALARNPLLLTIIAYLYTDTEFVLPHSRAEFYRNSTDVLLELWHPEYGYKFKTSAKRAVLRHLALFCQDTSHQQAQDRHSIDYSTALEQVRQVLPELNLKPEDASSLLEEIVERSGLLLSIDGGERYQFAHLTLQEYFAATELTNDANGLLARFSADHDTWRETVKLWCGLDHDGTFLIRAVYEQSPLTAFECLADAQKVEPALAEEIIETFKARLGTDDDNIIIRAFGTVASDLRPRGAAVFKFLEETLATSQELARRTASANALSLTNLPQVALALARFYISHPEVHAPLVRTGDLAIPALVSLARGRSIEAVDDLGNIGTPMAAATLTSLLWHPAKFIATRAAWHLAALLPQPEIEDGLRGYVLTQEQRKTEWLDWIWQPFGEPLASALPVIAGRAAYLIEQSPLAMAPTVPLSLDPRLIIPICSITARSETKRVKQKQRDNAQKRAEIVSFGITEDRTRFVRETVDMMQASLRWKYLLSSLPVEAQFDLLQRLVPLGPWPSRDDWRNIFHPSKYDFRTSWHYRMILLIVIIASTLGFIEMIKSQSQTALAGFIETIFGLALMLPYISTTRDPGKIVMLATAPITLPYALSRGHLISEVAENLYKQLSWPGPLKWAIIVPIIVVVLIIFVIWSPVLICFSTLLLLDVMPWSLVAIFWLAVLGTGTTFWRIGKRRERGPKSIARHPRAPSYQNTT